ncbi:SDR family NAD(P)-dependent oxidoreductase [Lutibacter sp. HS1-25]|uniref:SDR family NAD(P)-dependent oxidoreductase n=1 Tax=Lutibacter sp. HS1-25 TaxID=2485000 RepID=UPI00101307D4|nr:SDR family NAD(P)-dependent oxidoreductase [Lutibacter sp. HS1-25]RXP56599.1 SDR family NAD(P)-dependent oxidoreductase [Lutibacter sp. HS1-25]
MSDSTFKNNYGYWVIVVGSAEGLGEAYTIALAKRKMNLILVDNQLNLLEAISKKVETDFGVKTVKLYLDLKDVNAVEKMMLEIEKVDCRLLIYNAAYSLVKPFLNHNEVELDNYIDVNTRTQLKLAHQFSKLLICKKQAGGILLMSSLAGLIGMQLVSTYAATKAFTWNLAEALHYELKPKNIKVMACIAGATATPAYLKTKPTYGFIKPQIMSPIDVAESALQNLGKKALLIPGFSNRFNYFILTRLLPRKMAASVANKTMLTMFQEQSNS